jgi:hypothetical protein
MTQMCDVCWCVHHVCMYIARWTAIANGAGSLAAAESLCMPCPCVLAQVNALQTANTSLRDSLLSTRQQLEGGELHRQLEAVSGSSARGGGVCWQSACVGRLGLL